MSTIQHLRWRTEVALVASAFAFLRALGPVTASNLAGWFARGLGPLLPVSRVADANLRRALPALDSAARRAIVRGVWDNLGRTVGELPHLARLAPTASGPGWELEGAEHVRTLAAHAGPIVLVSGHIGNWEVLPRVAAALGVPIASFYRPVPNRYLNAMILRMRGAAVVPPLPAFSKGATGAREALAWLRDGGRIGMLVDQKMNDGIECRLFGLPAMTAPAAASFALRYRLPLVPGHVRRLGPARFRVVCEAPLPLPDSGDRAADIAALTQAINDRLECWIRERPAEWLWLHRRWPRAAG